MTIVTRPQLAGGNKKNVHYFVPIILCYHADFQPNGAAPLAPSAISIPGKIVTYEGLKDFTVPKAMTKEDMDTIKAEFVQAARNAMEAGVW